MSTGERAVTFTKDDSGSWIVDEATIDRDTWRLIRLLLKRVDGSEVHVKLLRSLDWLFAHGIFPPEVPVRAVRTSVYDENGQFLSTYEQLKPKASYKVVGREVNGGIETAIYEEATHVEDSLAWAMGKQIWLDMPEMSAVGLADVITIDPCPEIQSGPGRLVTGTFQHTAGIVLDLKVESESQPIGVTATHPFWSVDRQCFVAAADLRIGERLETLDGTTVVESIVRRPEPETVYNIEVEGDHVYRVGESGVLVHNASAGEYFIDALKNCCGDNSLGFTKPGTGAQGAITNLGEVTDASKKEAQKILEDHCKNVPDIQVDKVEYIDSVSTAEYLQVHVLVSKPGDGITPQHNISMKCRFHCDGDEL